MWPDGAIDVLWGKSERSGGRNLLLQHLFDTAATAERIWDSYLSPHLREALDYTFDGEGRAAYVWIAGVHDLGKASPSFQQMDQKLAAAVREQVPDMAKCDYLAHSITGYYAVRDYLKDCGWNNRARDWYSLLVLGHHGMFTAPPSYKVLSNEMGGRSWEEGRRAILQRLNAELAIEGPPRPVHIPTRAVQLSLSAAVSMADWIASDSSSFPGVWLPQVAEFANARDRAARAWHNVGLRGGWSDAQLATDHLIERRFGRDPRPVQNLAEKVARESPGLMILEAPTGDGKTEAALAATEILAGLNGCDGVFVGMPTQATSDPMFRRVLDWADRVSPETPVGLLHGKRQLNQDWQDLLSHTHISGVDEFDCDDPFGSPQATGKTGSRAPSEWFLGRRRGLLMPIVVGTIDQLLMAATRTRYVGLRHLGLAGKVVVLDEVHACDVYMSQFLEEGLRWLADARVPVVVLTATLPPKMRRDLVHAYSQGLRQDANVSVDLPEVDGYPRVTWVSEIDATHARVETCSTTQPDRHVRLSVIDEREDWSGLTEHLGSRLNRGGTALVVCNTVGRAQECYRAVRDEWPEDVVLLHGRMMASRRSDITQQLLSELGPPGAGERPHRRIVVATQVAEQSFDIDVDLLATDLAPTDLLVQRAGRLHRHPRPSDHRGAEVRQPQMLVMGVRGLAGVPTLDIASSRIYGTWHLLSAAAGIRGVESWRLPSQAPELVSGSYRRTDWPASWSQAEDDARAELSLDDERRAKVAEGFLLSGIDRLSTRDLTELHKVATSSDDEIVQAVVRDGEESAEVVLVMQDAHGRYMTVAGTPLGVNGEVVQTSPEVRNEVLGSTVRLPASGRLTDAVKSDLAGPAGWADDPWLGQANALVLTDGGVIIGGYRLDYDDEVGLIAERSGAL